MPREYDRQYSVLIVSGSEKFDALVRRSLSGRGFATIDFRKNAAAARRCILEKYYDIVIVNCPLTDEFGHELAEDVAENRNASVLLAVPAEIYEAVLENVTDDGILVISKADPQNRIDMAVRFLLAAGRRMRKLEKQLQSVNEKMEEIRIVSRAKLLLVEKKNMSEDEAHHFIGKLAMDHGISRRKAAEAVLDELE
ncbi:MAG: ANTAR domain-containing protein [Lachnospiraceae bacterium]|nr:ANTAR domain-containing protein [Lachnospiraceae bacterium]